MDKRPSLRDVAREAGVSVSTVSLALRGDPRVKDARRREIIEIADRLGYAADPALSRLASQKWVGQKGRPSETLVYVVWGKSSEPGSRASHLSFLRGIQERGAELGYRVETFYLGDYPTVSAGSRVLYSRGVRGLILGPYLKRQDPCPLDIDFDRFTVVACGNGRRPLPFHTVAHNAHRDLRKLLDEISRRGYRRVGFSMLVHEPMITDDHDRLAAIAYYQSSISADQRVPLDLFSIFDPDQTIGWIREYQPEVVVSLNDSLMYALSDAGIRVPRDIGFAVMHRGVDGRASGLGDVSMLIGRSSVDLVSSEMHLNHWGVPDQRKVTVVDSVWEDGDTLRPA